MSKPLNLCTRTPPLLTVRLFLPSGPKSSSYCSSPPPPPWVTISSTSSVSQLFTLTIGTSSYFLHTLPLCKTVKLIHKVGTSQILQKVFYHSSFTILRPRQPVAAKKISRPKPGARSTMALTRNWHNQYLKSKKQAACAWKHKCFSHRFICHCRAEL